MLTRTRPILEPGRTCWVVSPIKESGLLIDGRDYFSAFAAAARRARRYILLAGWQFDSTVSLLRGKDRTGEEDPRLLPFLKELCRRTPELRICILCWDYSPAYLLQREWFQEVIFNPRSVPRLRFLFDDRHAIGASHHQKFVVVDGALAFAGSMDLCHERWDVRDHPATCEDRLEAGPDTYAPYHEVQSCLTGPAVADLVELFEARWRNAGGEDLALPPPERPSPLPFAPSVRIDGREVGLSRTVAQTLVPPHPSIREIERLYEEALQSADRFIYVENQYFGSWAVYEALARRLRDESRPSLNVVMIYPKELHSWTEEIAMGAAQAEMFLRLRETAEARGHRFGVYYSLSRDGAGREKARYIHSKVVLVDDRFMTVGSANTNNRSMGLDTELNVSWEARSDGDELLVNSLRRARLSLLAEHAGVSSREQLRRLRDPDRLVETLDARTRDDRSTLRLHPLTGNGRQLVQALTTRGLRLDLGRPAIEEQIYEQIAPSRREQFGLALRRLRRVFVRRRGRRLTMAVNPPGLLARSPNALWTLWSQALRRAAIPLAVVLLVLLLAWGALRVLSGASP